MKDGIFISTEAIKEALQFADKGSIRTGLQGLYVKAGDDRKAIVLATDGHRLHSLEYDASGTKSPDTEATVKGSLMAAKISLILTIDEKADLRFKLKEVMAISKLHRKKHGGFTCMNIKFTKNRLVMIMKERVLIRYITPEAGIPEELVGMQLGINNSYLLEALDVFPLKDITISIADELSPIIIKPVDAEYPIHMLMPMRMDKGCCERPK